MGTAKKMVIITGGNTGLGFECAKYIAKSSKNYHVLIACRNQLKASEAVKSLIKETKNKNISYSEMNLSSLKSVREFANGLSNLPPLYALVCNAGVQFVDKTHYSKEGFEETFAVNHLSHFLLVNLLLDRMDKNGRIVFVSSGTHDPKKKTGMPEPIYENAKLLAYPSEKKTNDNKGLVGRRRYTTSKLCNIYCMYELVDRLNIITSKNITVNAFDPGLMPETRLARNYHPFLRFILKYLIGFLVIFPVNINTVTKSAKTLASLITDNLLEGVTGKYFEGKKEIKTSTLSYNKENQKNLWDISVKLSQLQKDESILL